MRETKFRIWDKNNGTMMKWEQLVDHYSEFIVGCMAKNDSEYPVMQYTGLKDKNGVEIYEGDIVKILGVDDEVFEVVFNGSYLQFLFINKRMFQLPDFDELEVIGNIYENPELIIKK